ncbi:MAG TPA: dTMP kinase [Fimbriimonadaceae bacterium]|jgi:dTMP kinase
MFVTLEGPEGAGKSTVMHRLAQSLIDAGHLVVTTREPGDGSLGPKIRNILLEGGALDPKAELFLFLADRAQHVSEVIRPALASGHIVICDRYVDSTMAYQGYGRGLDLETLRNWNNFATGNLKPDLTLLVDIEPSLGLARIKHKDRLDAEPLDFHKKVREGFLAESKLDPERWAIIDGSLDLDNVTLLAQKAVGEMQAKI